MLLKVGSFNLFQYVAPPFSWYIKKDMFSPKVGKETDLDKKSTYQNGL